jgi:XRE family transcriptional regulator of biofilm formation
MNRFGEKLRALREQHGLSIRELAHQLGYKYHSYIGRVETGETKPSVELIAKVAQLFNVSFDVLMNDEVDLDS